MTRNEKLVVQVQLNSGPSLIQHSLILLNQLWSLMTHRLFGFTFQDF